MSDTSIYARRAARWWAQALSPRATRPATFEDELTALIEQQVALDPDGVLLCSRPEDFPLAAPRRPVPPPVIEPPVEEPPVEEPPGEEPPVEEPPVEVVIQEVTAPDFARQPGWYNLLAIVAYRHKLHLSDFRGAIMWVYADVPPELKLTQTGRFRDLD